MTITFGDVAENHAGMEKLGVKAARGFSLPELQYAQAQFTALGCPAEVYNLEQPGTGPAYILIIRRALEKILREQATRIVPELLNLDWDKKAFMKGRVVNKKARWNLCFDDYASGPHYEEGKGRVIPFSKVPLLNYIRTCLPILVGEEARDLKAEGNLYYDVEKCGLSWHGDSERAKVIALRLGEPMTLQYQWFQETKPLHGMFKFTLEHGDMYIMGEKAVGTDWRKKKIPTLRHAVGCEKFTRLTK